MRIVPRGNQHGVNPVVVQELLRIVGEVAASVVRMKLASGGFDDVRVSDQRHVLRYHGVDHVLPGPCFRSRLSLALRSTFSQLHIPFDAYSCSGKSIAAVILGASNITPQFNPAFSPCPARRQPVILKSPTEVYTASPVSDASFTPRHTSMSLISSSVVMVGSVPRG